MSIVRSPRHLSAPLVAAVVSVWLSACGGSQDMPKTLAPCPALPGAAPGDPAPPRDQHGQCDSTSTPYFVLPVQAADGTLPPAVNDPGPEPLSVDDCAPPAGIEIATLDDYESGVATKTYTYNDSTCEVMPVPLKDWEPASTPIPAAWGGNRCGSLRALHLAGIYSNYGAGIGTLVQYHDESLNPDESNPNVTFTEIQSYWPGDAPSYVPGLASSDVSAWDGITFWARRGLYGETGFRPGLLDRTTSDDFNKQFPPDKAACRSIYTVCSCQNGKPCTPWDPAKDPGPDPASIPTSGCYSGFAAEAPLAAGTYCWDPAVDKWPSADPTLRCGQTACNFDANTPIPTMIFNPTSDEAALLWMDGTMTCSPEPYVFHDSTQPAANYCYRPGMDADPAEKMERCNDGWLGSVPIDTNWKRYYVAFSDMRQGNVDQRSPGMDLTSIESLVIAFPGGDLDVWIDDIGFYRAKK
jgi:hypothetical protein